ncbi:MAG: tRNA (adenosine(37)-N6)-threonylcarbamoyltransferase complex ATPase subunit type 1 TsaE [Clostridia bacterium]|nr:tRNA (adenosine(37)-N6)-threonylcarbamoyltransferase complex ATPase subunit type 1 TsaE [Clostridia bacterium]
MEYKTYSPEETAELGKKFALKLQKGDTVCMDGEMGAGKTVFVQGCAEALGYKDAVTSPTFTLCNEYITDKFNILHYDLYRIMDEDDLFSVGFYDNDGDIVFVEWAGNADITDRKCIHLKFEYGNEPNERIIKIPD